MASADRRTLRALIDLAAVRTVEAGVPSLADELAGRCVELLPIDSCVVLLADRDGELSLLAASRSRADVVGLLEVSNGQGPATESCRTSTPVHCDDLSRAHSRWPAFAPAALADGARAVSALPLRRGGRALGAIDLVRDSTGPLPADALELGQALADSAAVGLVRARSLRRKERIAAQWRATLDRRVLVQQASGILAERLKLPIEHAARLLTELAAADALEPHRLAERFVADPSGSTIDSAALIRALERAVATRKNGL